MNCFSASANSRVSVYRLSEPTADGLGGYTEQTEGRVHECWAIVEHVKGEAWYSIEDHARVSGQRAVTIRYTASVQMRDIVVLDDRRYNILALRATACDGKREGKEYIKMLIERCKDV